MRVWGACLVRQRNVVGLEMQRDGFFCGKGSEPVGFDVPHDDQAREDLCSVVSTMSTA